MPSEKKNCFAGCCFLDFEEKLADIDISQYIQAGISKTLTCLDDIDSEKGACGRYNDKERDKIDFHHF